MIGQRFGRLVVLARAGSASGHITWSCRCDCGGMRTAAGSDLRRGFVKSCGCAHSDASRTNGLKQMLDLVGKRFGSRVVIRRLDKKWLCRCDCGAENLVRGNDLRKSENCQSCCRSIHGHARDGQRSPTYHSWVAMLNRCLNTKVDNYARYGGAGVKVCERWSASFENFLADMGARPDGTTIDRYPNPAGNYEPTNCRWATPLQQRHNRRAA